MSCKTRSYEGHCGHCGHSIHRWLPTEGEPTAYQGQWVRCAECDRVTWVMGERKHDSSPVDEPPWVITDPDRVDCWFPQWEGKTPR